MKQNCNGIEPYNEAISVDGVEFCQDDILLANIRPYLKKAWKAEFNGACSTDVLSIKPIGINADFFFHCIEKDDFFNYVMSAAKGSKMPRGDKQHIMEYTIKMPSEAEQRIISKFIELVTKRISEQQKLVDALKLYKRGVLQRLFKANITEHKENNIGSLFTVTRGYVLPLSEIRVEPDNEYCYPVYSSQTKNEGLMGYYNQYLYEDAITWTTDGANAGFVRFRKGKFYCTNVCGVLLNDDGFANEYIAERLNSVTKRHVSYVGNPKLMNNVMAEITIEYPSLEEQRKNSLLISQMDKKIQYETSVSDSLAKLKTALLQQMFI
ncbi:MAG: restriction endonuclease subunit S [Bacteroidales bacterium]|nr:restriction endonuclease subunit S [Bacteroidales bacterium]